MKRHPMTPWFSVKDKPVRVGEYEFRWPCGLPRRAHWDGQYWFEWFPQKRGYSYFAFYLLGDEQWRGLAEKSAKRATPEEPTVIDAAEA